AASARFTVFRAALLSRRPLFAASTSVALSPARAGNRSSSRSTAVWASELGIVNSSASVPPAVTLPATITTAATSQAASVRHGWLATARPRRASAPSWRSWWPAETGAADIVLTGSSLSSDAVSSLAANLRWAQDPRRRLQAEQI